MASPPVRALGLGLAAAMLAGCAAPQAAPAGPFDVGMAGARFVPAAFTAHVGQQVVWGNNGTLAHTVTSDDPSGPLHSGTLLPGQTFAFTFAAPGTYHYHCGPHSYREADGSYVGMTGTITVTP